jgi:NADH-quinone oxidoreductase subunit K
MMQIGLVHYLVVSAILFSVGIAVVVGRRNAIMVLMGLEMILNGAGLNFVAFSRYVATDLDGQVVTIFVIMLAAAEAAVALGIVLNIFNNFKTINLDEADLLKE